MWSKRTYNTFILAFRIAIVQQNFRCIFHPVANHTSTLCFIFILFFPFFLLFCFYYLPDHSRAQLGEDGHWPSLLGTVSNKNKRKEKRKNKIKIKHKVEVWLATGWKIRRKFCCTIAILNARIKVVYVLFDHINEAIICDENQIFLSARRFKKPRYSNRSTKRFSVHARLSFVSQP